MKFDIYDIYDIDPDAVSTKIDGLAGNLDLGEWTPRELAAFVLTTVMANVSFALHTTLRKDIFERYCLAEAARQAFEVALAEVEQP